MADLPEIQSQTELAIDAAWVAAEEGYESIGLSIGSLATECERALWYGFRHVSQTEVFTGQKLRIFRTGHLQELEIIADLKRAGISIRDIDPETGSQYRVRLLGGHVRGKTDGEGEGFPEAPVTTHLVEAKSHKQSSFLELIRKGVAVSKPLHYGQCQTYMHGRGLTRCVYLAKNKNDERYYIERLEYDAAYCLTLLGRAERVIASNGAPAKLHEDPKAKAAFGCGFCDHRAVCHEGAWARRHCRTCIHATAELDGDASWTCARHLKDLTYDEQQAGCPNHLYTPSLVAGTQTDADEAGEWIEYLMRDGSVWRDGATS